MSNKSDGTKLEQAVAELFSKNGWWVHLLNANKSGQPADLIACKNQKAVLIDCKNCLSGRFLLKRIEDNQHLTAQKWFDTKNGFYLFCLNFPLQKQCYMIDYFSLLMADKTITAEYCKNCKSAIPISNWLENWEQFI